MNKGAGGRQEVISNWVKTEMWDQCVISTIAGGAPPPTPTAGTSASIGGPAHVTTDASGNIYFTSLNCIFKLDQNGMLTRIAGTSRAAYSGDGGPAINAQLDFFSNQYASAGLAVDGAGNLYIADSFNNLIRKIVPGGIITTVAGAGWFGFSTVDRSGDGGPAVNAPIAGPAGVAVDGSGNIFIADYYDSRVREVSPSGIITTVAGSSGGFQCIGICSSGSGFSGDGGPATSAQLSGPAGIALDSAGNLCIADYRNNRIRKVSPQGIITTVAGNGVGSPNSGSFSADGGPATSAGLWSPTSLAIDAAATDIISGTLDNARTSGTASATASTLVLRDGSGGASFGYVAANNQWAYLDSHFQSFECGAFQSVGGPFENIARYSADFTVATWDKNGGSCAATANAIAAPDGNSTADTITALGETLRASEERFRRMFQYSAAGTVLVSPDFCFLQINAAFCDMLVTPNRSCWEKPFRT
jgi:hypothetical protein